MGHTFDFSDPEMKQVTPYDLPRIQQMRSLRGRLALERKGAPARGLHPPVARRFRIQPWGRAAVQHWGPDSGCP
eukprot:10527226-Alexandrium_andersonii.AAC.1